MNRSLSPGKKRPWILPLNHPPLVAANEASHMLPDDLVVGVVVEGRARAYPWFMAANYHVINDSVIIGEEPAGELLPKDLGLVGSDAYPWYAHTPLLITLCEACAGAGAFIPVLPESPDHPLVFALADGATPGDFSAVGTFTICDLETQSRWHPLTGTAGSGPLAGRSFARIPAFTERWDRWVRDYPDTEVALAGMEMRRRPHVRELPGVEDAQAAHSSLRVLRKKNPQLIDGRLDPGEMILGASIRRAAVAVPLSRLRHAGGVALRELDGEPCLFVLEGNYRGLVFSRTLEGRVLDLRVQSTDPLRLEDPSGTTWNGLGEALSGEHAGKKLALVPDGYVSKWSEWSLSHPSAAIVE